MVAGRQAHAILAPTAGRLGPSTRDRNEGEPVTLDAILVLAAIAGASGLAWNQTRDPFWRGFSVLLVVIAVVAGIRAGIDLTRLSNSPDELLLIAGGLIYAGSIVVIGGLPRAVEDRILLGPARFEWEFDRALGEARRPFLDAAAAAADGLLELARWRSHVTSPPPNEAWATLTARLEEGDVDWADMRDRQVERDEWSAWTARSDQVTAEWTRLREPLVTQRHGRRRFLRGVGRIGLGLAVACVVAGALNVPTVLTSLPPSGRAPIVPDHPPGRTVGFAPLGVFPTADLERLAAFYGERYDLAVRILPPLTVPEKLWDSSRQQLAAEDLIALVANAYPEAADARYVVIGFVSEDIYIRGRPDWRWAFGLRAEGHLAVVSTARMRAPRGLFLDVLETARLRKMATRDIGILYFGLPLTDDRQSVLYRDILGVPDLDSIGEDY